MPADIQNNALSPVHNVHARVKENIHIHGAVYESLSINPTCLRRLQERVKMSNKEESRNDDAIFLCFVSGCDESAWRNARRFKEWVIHL